MIRKWMVISVVALFANATMQSQHSNWPTIRPFDRTFAFSDEKDMFLHFHISDVKGKEVYYVECSTPFSTALSQSDVYLYSRAFECRVALPGSANLPDTQLLAFDGNIDKEWENRAGFQPNELIPECQKFPDWGATRTYRFRHMKIVIQLYDVNMIPLAKIKRDEPYHTLKSLKVRISGEVDLDANAEYGGFSQYKAPDFWTDPCGAGGAP